MHELKNPPAVQSGARWGFDPHAIRAPIPRPARLPGSVKSPGATVDPSQGLVVARYRPPKSIPSSSVPGSRGSQRRRTGIEPAQRG
jgi:hypothetical protein